MSKRAGVQLDDFDLEDNEPLYSHNNGKANDIDKYVGNRLKLRRLSAGLSQDALGKTVSVSIQQIQKYESGTNRISCGKLYQLATFLNVQVEYFFDGLEKKNKSEGIDLLPNDTSDREILLLVRCYKDIKEPSLRKKILSLMKTLSLETPASEISAKLEPA